MWVSALQVSVDHLRALNATSVELLEGQQDLEPAVRERREHLLALLQEPSCQGCAEALSQARALELGANFSQVRPQDGGLSERSIPPLPAAPGIPGGLCSGVS